jgi:hypothetical protein
MHDRDVRSAILSRLNAEHADDQDTRIVEEMGIWSGSVRVDVAVINGELCGYELKSDRDTLTRLPAQAEIYSRVFDKMYLVVGERHAPKARRIIPRWWGVIIAKSRHGSVSLSDAREAKSNPTLDPVLVAQLMWREEALAVLERHNLAKGWRSKSADAIHRHLAASLPVVELSNAVRSALKARAGWLRKSIGDQGQVAVHCDLDPSGAATGIGGVGCDLLDTGVSPAAC